MTLGTARFGWREEYTVHVEDLDVQHHRITSLIADLHVAVLSGVGRIEQERLLTDVMRFSELHCADEEQFMARYNYPELGEHREAHQQLLADIRELLRTLRDGEAPLSQSNVTVLFGWFDSHLLSHDRRYSQYLQLRDRFALNQ